MRKSRMIYGVIVAVFIMLFSAALAQAKILVVAPHPDDDVIMGSGIVSRAIQRGEDVRIVYITNGDYYGTQYGYTREGEAVTGQSYLGNPENNLIFLGYPDGYLYTVYNDYPNATDRFVSPNGISATYGNRGLGRLDYHSYRFGVPANYNTANIITDLSDIISSFRPDHILVTSEFDYTTDHATAYQLVKLAATAVCNNNSGYNPVVHKTIIWWSAQYWWPNLPIVWPNSPDPTVYLAQIPNVDTTGLIWADRESLTVPLSMQLPNYVDNPKALALNAHQYGQKGVYGYIGFFLHKDEVFWPENVVGNNHPPVVNAGSDQMAAQGSVVNLDGSQSMDPDLTPLTFQWVQRSGTPVQLSYATSASPSFVAPVGLTQDEILSFELVVSDGQFVTLPDSVTVRVAVAQSADTNIAPLAMATASSQASQYGQTAARAVDGVIDGFLGEGDLQVDGYPGDATREWSAVGERIGAWLHLAWPVPYTVDGLVLHDRINLADNITSATITFSDGSSIPVGPLNNNGTATTYTFPARVINSLRMTVTGVASTTYEIGLAEIQVFGTPTGGTQYTLTTSVSPSGSGSIAVNPAQSGYYSGTQVTLTATANTGYTFSGWSGGATGTTNPLTTTITANTSVTANFTAIPGTLTVTPATALTSSGMVGGPFTPSSATYTLTNGGNTTINWSASATQSWITLSSASGSLAPGANTTVIVSINSNANSTAVGSYSDTVTFTNLTNGNGSTTRGVNLTITPVVVQPVNVAPLATLTASSEASQYGQTAAKAVDGVVDGYPNDGTREWSTVRQGVGAWLNLSWSAPYSVNQITLYDRINLDDNITSATITFSDGSSIPVGPLNNNGTATTYTFPARVINSLRMTVTGVASTTYEIGLAEIQVFGTPTGGTQYTLTTSVSPSGSGSIAVNPAQSGYYSGTQVTLTATANTGYTFSGWSGGATGTTNPLTTTITANTSVTANFTAIPGTLTVTPATALTSSGMVGGPFTPSSATYTLTNGGNTTINWSASATQSWITLSSASGSLAPGANTTVIVSINSNANSTAVGSYSDTVTFTNLTNGNGSTTRGVNLTITPVVVQPVNVAPLATLTASSEASQYGQTAAKAVDGVVDGYPNDGTREWSTVRQGVGAWLNLSWSAPYSVNQITLYDRINLDDNITSATITFSDGSSIPVGPLNNNGTATTYTFPARVINSLRMTVTGVASTTYEIGLAEIQVFGTPTGGTQYTLTTSVSPSGSGSIAVNPAQSGYYSGTQVTLTATANTGYTFSGWSGGATGTTNPLTTTITANTSVTANFTAIPGTLTVTPATALTSSGMVGGPFTPSSATYTLTNGGNTTINWSASATQSWITLSSASGSLAPGANTTVIVSINSNANSTAVGSYSDTVTFTNLTNGNGSTTRGVNLTITPVVVQPVNVAPLATLTASSEASQYGQTAAKAVDGVVDGYPNDGTREWSTVRQGVGAWLNLSWSAPYSVNQITLYDRINLDDNITSATITFSDGSSIPVGPLNNNGTATTYTFPARVINSLRMTVTGVASTTYEIGLAEIQVFGTPTGGTQYTLTTSVSPSGSGSIAVNPAQSGYYSGTQVTLTATANTGYTFSGWSGGATGTTNPLTTTITANTSVTANFTAIPGTLTVTPATALTSSGMVGGPFTPSSATYTLTNGGNTTINWSASATQSWITLSSASGSLAPGANTTVIVSINSSAASMPVGVSTDSIAFVNLTNGLGTTMRDVTLTIALQTSNIALLATATASSESSQYGQTAAKAIDGVINGYPVDQTREWSTVRQGVGAWLNLSWSAPYSVNQITLYDRINLDDNITSATITFSDGSSIPVGPLNNNGTATTYTFPARVINSLRMTVTGVASTTYEIGLAEIQVFGY